MENLNPYQTVLKKIRDAAMMAGRTDLPELVAVSKFQSIEAISSLYQQGQRIFGENYVQELIEKKTIFDDLAISDLSFHFIGHLQSNKVKVVLPYVTTIHSVDSPKLFLEIEKRASEIRKKMRVYFQINIDQEESKGGFLPSDLPGFCAALPDTAWVEKLGLMAIPNPEFSPTESFKKMQCLSKEFCSVLGSGLSLGMSQDFEEAIRNGATSVRVGSALFGPRR